MEAGRSGRLYRWTGDTRPEEKGGVMVQKGDVAQSKVGGWGGGKYIEGEGKQKIQKTVDNGGAGFGFDVTLATEPEFGSFSDQCWNTTKKYFAHTSQPGRQPNNSNYLNIVKISGRASSHSILNSFFAKFHICKVRALNFRNLKSKKN